MTSEATDSQNAAPVATPTVSRAKMLKGLFPHLPAVFWAAFLHVISLSPTSHCWDLKSVLIVTIIRSYLHRRADPPPTVERLQRLAMGNRKVPAGVLMAPVKYEVAPGDEGETIEARVAEVLAAGAEAKIPDVGIVPLTAEWIGAKQKSKAEGDGIDPDSIVANKAYDEILSTLPEGEESPVILYLHGGAYYVCDPQTHRPPARQIAKTASARVFLIRYRLAPQGPFPSALLDALVSYLYLIYPPPGALHKPVPASKVILAGDSAGGGLSFALLQLLHNLQDKTLSFHGQERDIPLPAGIIGISSFVDATRCFSTFSGHSSGSEDTCAASFDYLPSPSDVLAFTYAPSPAWNPELRKAKGQTNFYCADALLTNPYVSPIAAESWPTNVAYWMSAGDECLRDQNRYLAQKLRQCGVRRLRYEHYEHMPHVFQSIIPHHKASARAWKGLGEFIDAVTRKGEYDWKSVCIDSGTLAEKDYELGIDDVDHGKLKAMMEMAAERSINTALELDRRSASGSSGVAAAKL